MSNRDQEKVIKTGNTSGLRLFFSGFGGKTRDIVILIVCVVLLLVIGWSIFHSKKNDTAIGAEGYSANEWKAMRILQEIEGVGEASVVVSEDSDGVQSVVVICEGARNISVVMDIREAVATALNTSQKSVKIYLKKV